MRYPSSRRENPYLEGKMKKRASARAKWMQRQLTLRPPKDPNWFLKFKHCPHLGYILFFKQFGLPIEECVRLCYNVSENN